MENIKFNLLMIKVESECLNENEEEVKIGIEIPSLVAKYLSKEKYDLIEQKAKEISILLKDEIEDVIIEEREIKTFRNEALKILKINEEQYDKLYKDVSDFIENKLKNIK